MTETKAQSNSGEKEAILNTNTIIVHKAPITLLDCPATFSGSYGNDVERFLNYIAAYKHVKIISDEQALAELPHLLHGPAYTWWTKRQDELKSWSEVVLKLRQHFEEIRPAHIVYADIFKRNQDVAESWVEFLNEKVELFAQLPHPQPTERMQLDMIYGFLSPALQQKLQRNELESMAQLVARVKEITQKTKFQEQNLRLEMEKQSQSAVTLTNETNEQPPKRTNNAPNMERTDNEPQSEVDAIAEDVKKVRAALEMMQQVKEKDDYMLITSIASAMGANEDREEIDGTDVAQCASAGTSVPQKYLCNQFHIDSELMNQINNLIDDFDNSDMNEPPPLAETMTISSSAPIATAATVATIQPNAISACAIPAQLAESTANSAFPVGANVPAQTEKNSSAGLKRHRHAISRQKYKLAKRASMLPMLAAGSNHQTAAKTAPSLTATSTSTTITATTTTLTTLATTKTTSAISAISTTTTTPVTKQQASPIVSAASESHSTLTTKMISPADLPPGVAKYVSTKMKNVTACASPLKCHQCGAVGFYRSICPNCSPIYHYKPHGSANR